MKCELKKMGADVKKECTLEIFSEWVLSLLIGCVLAYGIIIVWSNVLIFIFGHSYTDVLGIISGVSVFMILYRDAKQWVRSTHKYCENRGSKHD